MNKRNIALGVVVAAIIGSGVALAGGKYCEHGGGEGYGHGHGHGHGDYHKGSNHGERGMMGGHMLERMTRHLDLTDQQQDSLKQLMEQRQQAGEGKRSGRHGIMQQAMQLDPMSPSYDAEIEKLADQVAEMARGRALQMAAMQKQVAEILTPEQRAEMQEMMQKQMERMAKRHQSDD